MNILLECIDFCLSQTYSNFEIVISENSDTNSSYKEILSRVTDGRIKVVRAGGLSMCENWENAITNCCGELVFPIGDKIFLHRNALKNIIQGHFFDDTVDILSFRHTAKRDDGKLTSSKDWQKYPTEILTNAVRTGDLSMYQRYGVRGYSLIFKKDFLDYLKKRNGTLCIPVSPDFTLAFLSTLHTNNFLYCDECFFDYSSKAASNGFSSSYGGKLSQKFFSEMDITLEDCTAYVPLKIYTVWNSVLNDFFRVCKRYNLEYDINEIDIVLYWKCLFSELVNNTSLLHIDRAPDFVYMYDFLQAEGLTMNPEILKCLHENRTLKYSDIEKILSGKEILSLVQKKLLNKIKKIFSSTCG